MAELEEQRLFSGRYDTGDALVTVNAGAGGTDAQDWAEIVLRMLMRWAERAASRSSCWRPARGRKRASSRPRSVSPARTPTACSEPSAAYTGSCACRRSTRRTAARRASRGSRWRPWSRTRGRSRSTRTTCRWTPTGPRALVASTSTRRTPPCASPTARRGSSCSARTSARSPPTARPRWRCCARSCGALGARTSGGDRAREGGGAGRQLRLADPLVRDAPVHDGQGRTVRATRWATSSACWTEISMGSCVRICSPARARRDSARRFVPGAVVAGCSRHAPAALRRGRSRGPQRAAWICSRSARRLRRRS